MPDGGRCLAARQFQAAELVVAHGEPLGLRVPLARRREREQILLDRDGLVPLARLHRQVAQRVESADVRGPALHDVTEQRAGLVGVAGRARSLGAAHGLRGLRVMLAAHGGALEPEHTQRAMADGDERAEREAGG